MPSLWDRFERGGTDVRPALRDALMGTVLGLGTGIGPVLIS
jgi:hypothetical protein